jgi:hypothetical protein
MARSAIPGSDVDCGISVLKFVNSAPDEVNEAGTFGYPRERRSEQRVRRPLAIRDRRRGVRRVPALQ